MTEMTFFVLVHIVNFVLKNLFEVSFTAVHFFSYSDKLKKNAAACVTA